MDGKEPYIRQQEEGENLYSRLQKKTLEEVQRLSGKVWTDFNVHDPGVTLADIANYALTETSYKLGFDLADYLTGEGENFNPKRFGLLPAKSIPRLPSRQKITAGCSSPISPNWRMYG